MLIFVALMTGVVVGVVAGVLMENAAWEDFFVREMEEQTGKGGWGA